MDKSDGDVLILTGPKHSGKTTALAAWTRGRTDVAGVLQPTGPTGRSFVDLGSSEAIALEPVEPGEAEVLVRRFRFRAAAFDWANGRLRAAAEMGPRYLVIDEVGPLELGGGGLRPGLQAVVAGRYGTLLLTVREALAEAVHAELVPQARIVPCADWPQVGDKDASAP